jgi:hypothetical protein
MIKDKEEVKLKEIMIPEELASDYTKPKRIVKF